MVSDRIEKGRKPPESHQLAVNDLPIDTSAKALTRMRYKHRSSTFCRGCRPIILGWLEAVQGEGEAAADVVSEIEAFADRSSGGMAMDSLHRHHAGVWGRRTCQALPDLDKTSQALEKACVACTDDLQVAEEIKSALVS